MMATQVKAITQDTFDCVVRENMNDFEMEESEALDDAIQQFKSQGVSLSMIIKAVPANEGHLVIVLVNQLQEILEKAQSKANDEIVKDLLNQLSQLFAQDIAYRYQSSKLANSHQVLYKACQIYQDNKDMLKCCLCAFASLLDGQPDLLDGKGIHFILSLLEDSNEENFSILLFRIMRFACTKHEANRIEFVLDDGIRKVLCGAEKFRDSSVAVREACKMLRTLTMDDDVRVPFGKAHEHTKLIVMEHSGLERLCQLIEAHENDSNVASELYSTLGKLLVRSEFCQQMVDLGGLEIISRTINVHIEKQNVVRQCITLLKAMSGNDDVKVAVVKAGGVELLLHTMNKHKSNPQICEACFGAITTLALRNPSHCDIFMANNAAILMTQAMKEHCDHPGVQKQACMAIRNLVARTRYHSKAFIDNGAEGLIRKARVQHKNVLDDESKAALRDLDVDVELKERWRGENVGVTS